MSAIRNDRAGASRARGAWMMAALLALGGVAGAATKYVYDHYVLTAEDNGDGTEHVTIEDTSTGKTILDENLPKDSPIFIVDMDENGNPLPESERMTIVVDPTKPDGDLSQQGYISGSEFEARKKALADKQGAAPPANKQ